jgi:hypothetical protein
VDDEERRKRLKTLIAIIARLVAQAESRATTSDDQTFRGASNELAQLRQLLNDLELKISNDESSAGEEIKGTGVVCPLLVLIRIVSVVARERNMCSTAHLPCNALPSISRRKRDILLQDNYRNRTRQLPS